MPVTFSYLLELGRQAARAARWYGIPAAPVREGYPDSPLAVHSWPEEIWDEAWYETGPGHGIQPLQVPGGDLPWRQYASLW